MGKIIDVSEFQGTINWSLASSEVSLAIIRAQDGDEDKRFRANVKGCRDHGIPFGVYAFFRAKTADAGKAEAHELFKRVVAAKATDARFYVLDCEIDGITPAAIKAGVKYLESKGCRVGLYIAHHQWSEYGGDYGQSFTWVPRYGHRPSMPCDLWQYTSSGTCRGIKGKVDLNCINGELTLPWFVRKPHAPKPKPDAPKPKPAPKRDKIVTVRKGDTLSAIASRNGTTWQALAKHNRLAHPDVIHVGQKIKIPK